MSNGYRNDPRSSQFQTRTQPSADTSGSEQVSRKDLTAILDGTDPQLLVHTAENIAKSTLDRSNPLSSSQIRNIYGSVKILEMNKKKDYLTKLILLKPKLAYAVGRHDKVKGLKVLKDVLSQAIDIVAEDKEKRFPYFCRFFEAILAYHKAHGGK